MISWLKKYGIPILKDVAIVLGFVPQMTQATNSSNNQTVSKVSDTLTGIASLIQTAEAMFAAAFGAAGTGAAKMQAILPMVSQMVQEWLAADFPGTAKIGDQALFDKAVGEIAQGVVDVLNSIQAVPATAKPISSSGPTPAAPVPLPVPAPAPVASPAPKPATDQGDKVYTKADLDAAVAKATQPGS